MKNRSRQTLLLTADQSRGVRTQPSLPECLGGRLQTAGRRRVRSRCRDEIRIVLGRRLNDLLPGDETGDAHGIIAQQLALKKRTAHLTIRWSQKKWEEFMGMPYSTALTSEASTSCRRSDGGNPSSAAWRLSVASIVVAAARYWNRARHNPRGDLVKGMRRSLALSFRCWSLVYFNT